MSTTTVLITGFEPFGGHATNPSLEVATALQDHPGWVTGVLPVDFSRCVRLIGDLVRRHRPQVVLSLGLAPGRERLGLERVAVNLIDARIPDNAGEQPVDVPVIPAGPSAYFTTLPVKAMRRAIHEAGIEAELSLSAGTYGCNAVMYAGLHAAAGGGGRVEGPTTTRAGFAHLPPVEVLGVAGATRAVVAAVECALATDTDDVVPDGAVD